MKFLDLNTGYSFDGLWTGLQSKGYVFWFPNEQSINLTYTMPICILTDDSDIIVDSDISVASVDTDIAVPALTLTIEENDIFSFIVNDEKTDTIDGYTFTEPRYTNTITTVPEKIGKYYAHIVNVACSSKNEGEFICKIKIGDSGYIRVGADFYGEWEPTYINLSNMGVEIPDTVQKAIYDSNVHEDLTDNILINRKFKELLSNYWDIIANKGSYKSLKNALEWFEWDDTLNVKEIWRHSDAGRIVFDDREIMSVIENKVEDTFNNFLKTTFISLYCAMQEETDEYDSEGNPELKAVVLKWSRDDLQLKLALLAQFFGIYFLPIHLSILHAAVEDKVFTNAIKQVYGTDVKRDDCFGDFNYVECNIKENAVFKMTNVSAQVTDSTIFGIDYPNALSFGVDIFTKNDKITTESLKTFAQHYYTGPGVIIPIEVIIPNQNSGDFVKETLVDFTDENSNVARHIFYDIIKVKHNRIKIKFNFLAKSAQHYSITMNFMLASGKTITRLIEFDVEDADNLNINIYKVRSKDDSNGFTITDFKDTSSSKYLFKIQNDNTTNAYIQYLPYMLPTDSRYTNYKGIKLTRTVIVDLMNKNKLEHIHNDSEILFIRALMKDDFLEFAKYDDTGQMTYLIFVSKKFYTDVPNAIYNNKFNYKFNIIRNDLGFYPQFHYLEKMNGNSIDDYTINQYEAVCCAVEINNGNAIEDFRYGHLINDAEWTFYNPVTVETIQLPFSSRTPFVAKSKPQINDGYYDVSFKYSLTNGVANECRLDSAFRIKSI